MGTSETANAELARALANLASAMPETRLKAVRALREAAHAQIDAVFHAAEVEQVKAVWARGGRASWQRIADALGVTRQHAQRLYGADAPSPRTRTRR